jgi:hypothetical protein
MSEGLFSRQIVELLQSDENRICEVSLWRRKLWLSHYFPVQEYSYESSYEFVLPSGGVDAWRNLATAINNSQVDALMIRMHPEDDRHTTECYGAFLGELKNNKTIKVLTLHLDHQTISTFLGYFLQNNSKMREPGSELNLEIAFDARLTREQITVLTTLLRDVRLWHLDLAGLSWLEDDGSLEQIISACLGVNRLYVCFSTTSYVNVTAVASLLRDPMSMLTYITISIEHDQDDPNFDGAMALREIAESLVGNTRLKTIELLDDISSYGFESVDEIDDLLCDSSTLEKIRNSNHTLEEIIHIDQATVVSTRSIECLVLNHNTDKNKVIQNKVMQFYFLGHFDPAPFANMPLSVLPTVMSVGKKVSNKQTALFELLRIIPDLCNVSSRSSSDEDRIR